MSPSWKDFECLCVTCTHRRTCRFLRGLREVSFVWKEGSLGKRILCRAWSTVELRFFSAGCQRVMRVEYAALSIVVTSLYHIAPHSLKRSGGWEWRQGEGTGLGGHETGADNKARASTFLSAELVTSLVLCPLVLVARVPGAQPLRGGWN